jgi:hypothetical protein
LVGRTRAGLLNRIPRLVALLAGLVACAHLPGAPRALRECPGTLRSTDEIVGDFRLQQRVRIRSGEREIALRIAVEKRGRRLVVVGLNAFGAVVFQSVQTGGALTLDALPAPALEVPPVNVLRDLHRVRFLAAETPQDADGTAQAVRDGVRITEIWRGAELEERRFERVTEGPSQVVTVAFASGPGGAASATIDNGACGYTASFVTIDEEKLP